ncbi:MAG: transposase [Terriglobia bacterium]
MDAVGYYAVRDLAALRDEAYWSYCERQWKLSKPTVYPSFREWRRASERCEGPVIDACEMREKERGLIKASQRTSPRMLRKAVDRYVGWQVFAYWARTALESDHPLPGPVDREVRQRCPGFLASDAAAKARRPAEEPYQRFNRLMRWIEDHEFARARKQGWFDALVNYTGLVPSLYASGEVSIHGPITHQGPAWLRWALVTAANAVTRSRSPLGRRYARLRRQGKHPNVAKTAVAVSMARCVYGVLKHGEPYQVERWGRRTGAASLR